MSLYGKTNTSQGLAISNLTSVSGLPVWMLVLAGYFALITLTNNISNLIDVLESDNHRKQFFGYFMGFISGILSVAALALFIFRFNTLSLYYLMITALTSGALKIAVRAEVEVLSPYFYWLQGLDSFSIRVIGWAIGWENLIPHISLLTIVGSVISVAFCAFLIYFHNRRRPVAQAN